MPKLRALPGGPLLNRTFEKLRSRELNARDLDNLTAGYYEALIQEGSLAAAGGGLFSRFAESEKVADRLAEMDSRSRRPAPYLVWEYKPNLNVRIEGLQGDLITNSHGMPDHEYALEKPPGTRRIAVLGDSITRGWGVPFGGSFEALLEDRLNAEHTNDQVRKFELLNFSVGGYRITQTLAVALDKAPRFQPDVYLVGISDVTILRRWGSHLTLLVQSGGDLRFDYLRQVVQRAAVRPDDKTEIFPAKLAPYRLPTIRWVIGEIKSSVERSGAKVILYLVPSVSDSRLTRSGFQGIPEIASEYGLPLLDLTDTFEHIEDLEVLRIGGRDRHPNERGHRLLYENLYRKIQADPEISRSIFGSESIPPATTVGASAASSARSTVTKETKR
ncbi:MAG: SGNH/GDSL hydrolase family protein [Acidobacteria bacterium]|nr:SGNH/GDSL hydrolase family protein [Acidobacteriota bacterium]